MARQGLTVGAAVYVQPTGGSEEDLHPRKRYGRIVGVDASRGVMGERQSPVYAVEGVLEAGGVAYFLADALRPTSAR